MSTNRKVIYLFFFINFISVSVCTRRIKVCCVVVVVVYDIKEMVNVQRAVIELYMHLGGLLNLVEYRLILADSAYGLVG